MLPARYAPNELYNIPLRNPRLHSLVMITIPILLSHNAAALPLISMAPRTSDSFLKRREGDVNNSDNSSSTVPAQIWVPILAITLFLVFAAIWTCKRKGWRHVRMFNWGTTVSSVAPAQETTELTAEQLAGSINANAATNATRTRRNRRPRRTPSQISTISLPAYNKEPGEQELVIYRGPEDMEDAGMLTAVLMPSVSEDGEDSVHSRDNSEAYRPMPHSPNDEPLLDENNSTVDQSTQRLQPGEDSRPRQSVETLNSSEEASSLMRVNGDAPAYFPDPRGEAPAYFEAVDLTEEVSQNGGTVRETSTQSPPASPPTSPERTRRRSGFRQFFNALPNRLSMHSTAHGHPSHSRADSSFSLVSGHGQESSHDRPSHRPSPSGSGSLLSLAPFRTISRQSNGNLNSPSLISLNSISAPLTHTLTRTEFTYPKSGPTPEQLKLISSRDSFARFAVPYGADAIAYAASTSRHDLDVPPPDFDLPDPVPSAPPAGPSRLRAMSNAADLARDQDQELQQNIDSSIVNDAQSARPSSPPRETLSYHVSQTENTLTSDPASDNVRETQDSISHVAPSSTPPSDSLPVDLATGAPPSSYKAPNASDSEEWKGRSMHSNAAAGLGLGMPSPSIYDRSASRASSVQTFATAAESMHSGLPHTDVDSDIGHSDTSEHTTPKVAVRHVLPFADDIVPRMG